MQEKFCNFFGTFQKFTFRLNLEPLGAKKVPGTEKSVPGA